MTGWHTRIQGTMYRLTDTGRLEREETPWLQHDYPRPTIPQNGKQSYIESSAPSSTH